MRYAFIRLHASQYPVTRLCQVLGVSRSGYYDALRRPKSERARLDDELTRLIKATHRASRQSYGSPRIHAELREQGHRIGRKRVARLMRQAGLRGAMAPRRGLRQSAPAASDLLKRQFQVPAPNRVWCSDIKQVSTRQGWLYLAVVLDLYSRRIVGHACSARADAELVGRALKNASARREVAPGLIHHSDRAAVYGEAGYRARLARHGMRRSQSRPGTPLDNAVVESFFSTLSRELVLTFDTRAEARLALFDYIECFYNPTRRHSTLGFQSPADYEAAFFNQGVSKLSG